MKKWIKWFSRIIQGYHKGSAMFDWLLDLNVQCFNKSKKQAAIF